MHEFSPLLSSDLETLITNPAEEPARLLAALVDEFYSPIYALAQALLGDPREAMFATLDAFVSAPRRLDGYSRLPSSAALSPAPGEDAGHARARIWLYRLALDAIHKAARRNRLSRALTLAFGRRASEGLLPTTALEAELWLACDALPEDGRLALFLHAVQGWAIPDIALLVGESENRARKHLDAAHSSLQRALKKAGFGSQALLPDELEPAVAQALCRRWPATPLAEPDRSAVLEELAKQAAR